MTVEILYTGSSKLTEVVYKLLIINTSDQGPNLAFRRLGWEFESK
jgi:hypothetical protein